MELERNENYDHNNNHRLRRRGGGGGLLLLELNDDDGWWRRWRHFHLSVIILGELHIFI